MKKILLFILSAVSIFSYYGCSELGRIDQIDESISAPEKLSVLNVTNTPGGAVIKVKVPNDQNLMGALAVYERNGEECKTKISKYVDTLVVEGFGNTDPREILLYSIGKNEKLSEAVKVTINPLLPPVHTVKFDLEETFGGVVVHLDNNETRAELAVGLLVDTILSDINLEPSQIRWSDVTTFHTSAPKINLTRRSLSADTRIYGVFLKDRWDNYSDTIFKILTPIEEIKLPTNTFQKGNFPGDYTTATENNESKFGLQNLWNGSQYPFYATSHSGPIPQSFTIKLGYTASISRIQKAPRPVGGELYSGSAPRTFEVYGSTNPNPDGSFDDSWHLLGKFEQFKPSGYGEGSDVGPITDEDSDYWFNRTEFELTPTEEITDPHQPVSYIRIKVTSTYATYGTEGRVGQVIIGDLKFWGQKLD